MSEVKVVIRTADLTRKAEVSIARDSKASELIQAAVDNWALPADTDYALVNTSSGKSIAPGQSLTADVVDEGAVLEVQPVLVAG